MNKKSILSMVFVGCMAFGSALVHAAEAIPSEEELLSQCKQFAVEDQVPQKEMDAYVTQCVLDLKEQYLPIPGDYPGDGSKEAPKETPKGTAR